METQQLLRANYLDILFDGRNKKYGSYELRREYGARTRKATATVTIGAALLCTIPFIMALISPTNEVVPYPVHGENTLVNIRPPEQPKVTPIAIPKSIAPHATIANPILKIVIDKDVVQPPKTIDEVKGKEIALTTNIGSSEGIPNDIVSHTSEGQQLVETVDLPDNRPVRNVDQMPSFDGDLDLYLKEHLQYPEDAHAIGDEGRVGIEFVVNRDGSISDAVVTNSASASLNAEALRVVRNMPKWKPGKQRGKPVRVYFKIPISFVLQ